MADKEEAEADNNTNLKQSERNLSDKKDDNRSLRSQRFRNNLRYWENSCSNPLCMQTYWLDFGDDRRLGGTYRNVIASPSPISSYNKRPCCRLVDQSPQRSSGRSGYIRFDKWWQDNVINANMSNVKGERGQSSRTQNAEESVLQEPGIEDNEDTSQACGSKDSGGIQQKKGSGNGDGVVRPIAEECSSVQDSAAATALRGEQDRASALRGEQDRASALRVEQDRASPGVTSPSSSMIVNAPTSEEVVLDPHGRPVTELSIEPGSCFIDRAAYRALAWCCEGVCATCCRQLSNDARSIPEDAYIPAEYSCADDQQVVLTPEQCIRMQPAPPEGPDMQPERDWDSPTARQDEEASVEAGTPCNEILDFCRSQCDIGREEDSIDELIRRTHRMQLLCQDCCRSAQGNSNVTRADCDYVDEGPEELPPQPPAMEVPRACQPQQGTTGRPRMLLAHARRVEAENAARSFRHPGGLQNSSDLIALRANEMRRVIEGSHCAESVTSSMCVDLCFSRSSMGGTAMYRSRADARDDSAELRQRSIQYWIENVRDPVARLQESARSDAAAGQDRAPSRLARANSITLHRERLVGVHRRRAEPEGTDDVTEDVIGDDIGDDIGDQAAGENARLAKYERDQAYIAKIGITEVISIDVHETSF